MDTLPPQYQLNPTPQERSLIAGFLLHFRAGFLQAEATMSDPKAARFTTWADPVRLYYSHAESVSRYLLDKIGYPVERGQMREDFIDAFNR